MKTSKGLDKLCGRFSMRCVCDLIFNPGVWGWKHPISCSQRCRPEFSAEYVCQGASNVVPRKLPPCSRAVSVVFSPKTTGRWVRISKHHLDWWTNQWRSEQLVGWEPLVQGLLRAHRRGELQDLRQDLREGDGGLCNRSDSIGTSDQELQLGVFLWLSQWCII